VNPPKVVYKHRLVRLVANKHSENEESRKGFDLLRWFELCRNWLSLTPEAGVYIPQLISLIREKDVTDPKDKIYGVLGLVPPLQKSIVVDYSLTTAEVYRQFAGRCVIHEIDHSLLSEITSRDGMIGLPSWCPNFNSRGPQTALGGENGPRSGHHAGFRKPWAYKHSIVRLVNAVTIACCGFVVDRIEDKVGELRVSFPLAPEGARIVLNWEQKCLRLARKTYTKASDIPLAYPRSLIARRMLEFDGRPKQSKPDVTEVYKEFKRYLQTKARKEQGDILSTNCLYYMNTFGGAQLGRAFFSTSAGRIGLGPSHVMPGDFVFIFENSMVPFIMRYWAPGVPNMLIGEGYVDGLMYNSAFDFLELSSVEPMQFLIS
jgi:hypothetical protein